jgi:Ca2+-binding RTX toxin-like protein
MAKPIKFGSEFLVNNTATASNQNDPQIAALGDGRFVVTWTDASATGGDTSELAVRMEIFHADGTSDGGEFLVNTTTTTGDQAESSVTTLADGRFVVAWTDLSASGDDTSGAAVRARIFNANGSTFGSEFVVNTTTAGNQHLPDITALADGGFVATWLADDGSADGVIGQLFTANGTKVGAEFPVNTTTSGGQTNQAVAAFDGGSFVVAWQDASATGDDTDGLAVRAQLFDSDGAQVGSEFLVNTTTSGDQSVPDVAVLDDERFVVVWRDESATGGDIRGQLFAADGTPLDDEFLVNTETENSQSDPEVIALTGGRFVVVWHDLSSALGDISSGAIAGQVFNADGSKSGAEFRINTATEGDQRLPSITELADGRIVVSWTDNSQSGGDTDGEAVRAQIFDPRETAIELSGTVADDEYIGTGFGDGLAGQFGNDTFVGGGGDDVLAGEEGNDLLTGNAGNDEIDGGVGRDKLTGGQGADRLFGDAGKDKLDGGSGVDLLTGGGGKDRFDFNSVNDSGPEPTIRDKIIDFAVGTDLLDLKNIDADTTSGGNDTFVFIGSTAFSSTAGELRAVVSGSVTIVEGDVDGDGQADFQIELLGAPALTEPDFIL